MLFSSVWVSLILTGVSLFSTLAQASRKMSCEEGASTPYQIVAFSSNQTGLTWWVEQNQETGRLKTVQSTNGLVTSLQIERPRDRALFHEPIEMSAITLHGEAQHQDRLLVAVTKSELRLVDLHSLASSKEQPLFRLERRGPGEPGPRTFTSLSFSPNGEQMLVLSSPGGKPEQQDLSLVEIFSDEYGRLWAGETGKIQDITKRLGSPSSTKTFIKVEAGALRDQARLTTADGEQYVYDFIDQSFLRVLKRSVRLH